jgi:beta-exotoxin I transport system ATP-binding protein
LIININKLTKYYGKHKGIENLTFSVNKGDIFGFIGPNGAGKSTTIRVLLNLIFATSGKAEVFGLDCAEKSKKIKKHIGYIPSDVNYYYSMTSKELFEYTSRFYKKDYTKKIAELVKEFDVDLNKKFKELSVGNKKKVAIIQAVMHSPKLLICDEPTSGLDPLMQSKFFDLVRRENEKGTTVLFSSHNLLEVERVCNRVAIIKDGSIIKTGTSDELESKNMYKINVHSTGYEQLLSKSISVITKNPNNLKFMYQGDINELLKQLSLMKLEKLTIEKPSLEDIFMHYYEEDKNE